MIFPFLSQQFYILILLHILCHHTALLDALTMGWECSSFQTLMLSFYSASSLTSPYICKIILFHWSKSLLNYSNITFPVNLILIFLFKIVLLLCTLLHFLFACQFFFKLVLFMLFSHLCFFKLNLFFHISSMKRSIFPVLPIYPNWVEQSSTSHIEMT